MFVGLAEAAEIMGDNKKKISVYHKRGKFPKAIQELSSGPIWTRDQIEHYKMYNDANVTVYYNDGEHIWKLNFNEPRELFNKTIKEFMADLYASRKKMSYTLLYKDQVDHLKSSMSDPLLVRILNLSVVAAHYNYGLLSDDEYTSYLKSLGSAPPTLGSIPPTIAPEKQEYEIIEYQRFLTGKDLNSKDIKALGKVLTEFGVNDLMIELRQKRVSLAEIEEEIEELAPESQKTEILKKLPTSPTFLLVRMFVTINANEAINLRTALRQRNMDAIQN